MKTKINHFFLLAFFALLTFSACQDEEAEVDIPNEQEVIQPNSQLANLLSRTTANFGAKDDILDNASCFSVELPVTIMVSDITIVIETEEDLEQLEDLLDDFYDDDNNDDDFLDFVFPITIIFSDYTEIVIENEDQLENLINDCEDDEDDVIECVDFVYPISFSIFDSGFDLLETVVIENDEALYDFLDDIEEDEDVLIVSLNFPVTLEYANGDTIEVNSNEELASAIEAAEDDCDDNDDDNDCEDEEINELLQECPWEVFLYTNDDLDNLSGPYTFTFQDDGNMVVEGVGNEAYTTTWELNETDSGLELNIASFYYYEEQFGNWLIVECDDDDIELVHLTVDGTGLFFDQDCEDDLDCSIADISDILQECPWDFSDGTGNFENNQMIFHPDGNLQITEGDTTVAIGGIWSLTASGDGLILMINELTAFQDTLGGDWVIIECDDEDGEITITRNTIVIELEQDCDSVDDDEVFDCFSDFELVECLLDDTDTIDDAVFNLSADTIGLIDCQEPFTPSFHISIADAEANINPIADTEYFQSITTTVYLRIEANSGNYEIFNIYLNAVECDYFECFGNYDLSVCDGEDGVVDGFGVFDLNLIFANCPNDDVVYTFHETLIDAEIGSNALITPYVNIVNPQAIYSKVSLAGDPNIFEIFTHNLIVEDCCQGSDVLLDDLVIYMPFGNQAKDLISGEFATDFNAQSITNNFVEDRSGNPTCAISFSGTDSIIIPVTTQNQLVQGDSFSISLWFKMNNTNAGDLEIFFRKPGDATQGFNLGVFDLNTPLVFDNLSTSIWDNDWNSEIDIQWENTDWHHLAVTLDGNNTLRLYRDGIQRGVIENSNFSVGSDPMSFFAMGESFQGVLDDLRVYKRVLTPNEISILQSLEADCSNCQ